MYRDSVEKGNGFCAAFCPPVPSPLFFSFFFVSFLVRHRSEGKEEKKRFEKHVHPMITFRQIRQLWCNFYQINRNI